jgi:hypothetical protein
LKEEGMPRVLICTPEDLQERLRSTLLWRTEVERLSAGDPRSILELIRERRPRLLIVDGRSGDAAELIQNVRADESVRHISIAALHDGSEDRAAELRKVGANVVLSEWQSTPLWDDAFQELLNIPPRRWSTFTITVAVGARLTSEAQRFEATARNISIRGLLVESPRSLLAGTVMNLFFSPTDPPEMHLVARVVWEKETATPNMYRQGVEFLGFHGDALSRIATFVAGGPAPEPENP